MAVEGMFRFLPGQCQRGECDHPAGGCTRYRSRQCISGECGHGQENLPCGQAPEIPAQHVEDMAIADEAQPIEPCDPEFVDGSYEGCGVCPDCLEDEDQAIESQVEMGELTDDQAREIHRDNESRRAMAGLLDHEPEAEPFIPGYGSGYVNEAHRIGENGRGLCGALIATRGDQSSYLDLIQNHGYRQCQPCANRAVVFQLADQGPQSVRGVDGSKDGA